MHRLGRSWLALNAGILLTKNQAENLKFRVNLVGGGWQSTATIVTRHAMFRIIQSLFLIVVAVSAWNFAESYRYGDVRVFKWTQESLDAQLPNGLTKAAAFARLGKPSTESQNDRIVRWEYTGHSLGLALPLSSQVAPPTTKSLVLVFDQQGKLAERLYGNF